MIHLRSVGTSLSVATIAIALASALVGCEGDSFGYSTRKLPSYQNGGGTNTPAQTNNDPSTPAPPSSSQGDPTDPQTTPSQPDAGATKADASPPVTSAPGTCGNPKCAATNWLCGCKATDSAGNNIVMGCQGGACACFDANGNDANDFDATCDDPASAAIAFQQCACN